MSSHIRPKSNRNDEWNQVGNKCDEKFKNKISNEELLLVQNERGYFQGMMI